MGLGDAFDDRQAEADACVVGANAFGAAPERFGEGRDQLWSERVSGILCTMALCRRFAISCSSSA